ncbi:aminoglycoside phosphotransferase family protein [Dactylosporangium aurantiacum]|uniref:Aminoglycoside phosphotransferase family protein n=1 Tax=Dactylosporangium aurantiacum TaxID=35754 RepID=A0A9Q9MA93_9ACTN|nr:aminoglycoside phosphotransferase family protein [Dactylosporangium aurantiacum]MDG6105063.1 aminoglycoside phosphotransferase family protein [Dactylosporangium aurantiacum]UWZ51593.1 aminoglycoside phosphotransferase family protein [Dactylosporangium aurantiacum]
MSSRRRPAWATLPARIRAAVEALAGGPVVRADGCPDGFSPGFAARLTLADGRRRFVKAVDADAWPHEVGAYRTEAEVAAALPGAVPAPRLLGVYDDGHWCALAFEDVDGASPGRPWTSHDLRRVLDAAAGLARVPAPAGLPARHPRLGGWAGLAADPARVAALRRHAPWAARDLPRLVALERDGLAAARGDTLVHGDLYPHNILLTADRVVFVDWPHARRGSPLIDLVTILSSAAAENGNSAGRIEPEQFAPRGRAVTAVLAAHAGFLLAGGLAPPYRGLEAITDAKLHLGLGALRWLRDRLGVEVSAGAPGGPVPEPRRR